MLKSFTFGNEVNLVCGLSVSTFLGQHQTRKVWFTEDSGVEVSVNGCPSRCVSQGIACHVIDLVSLPLWPFFQSGSALRIKIKHG